MDRMMDAVADEISLHPPANLQAGFAPTRGQGTLVAASLTFASFLARMVWLRLAGRCDLLHLNLTVRGSTIRKLMLAGVARTIGIPYVIHLHGGMYPNYFEAARPRMRRRIIEGFRGATSVIVLGDVWKRFVTANGLAPADRVVVLRNASRSLPLARSREPSDVRILFLGGLTALKGVPQLVDALCRLSDVPGWTAVLAGSGEAAPLIAELAHRGIGDRVSLPGWTEPEATAALLQNADILVLPSFVENLPMAVIEGMAAGHAVVTTPVGGTPEIIRDRETGLLVPPGDVGALADALRLLIADGVLRRQLGDNARAFHREHLDIGPYVRQLARVWRDAARAPPIDQSQPDQQS